MPEESERSGNVGNNKIQGKLMSFPSSSTEFAQIENQNTNRNDQTLSHFQAIYAGEYIDGVCAKYSQHSHVNVVQEPQIYRKAEPCPQRFRHYY